MYPKTLSEAIESLVNSMDKEVLEIISTMPEENVMYFHKGFDTWIKNNTGLLDENYELIADCNAKSSEEASLKILKELRVYLINNKVKYGWVGTWKKSG